MSVLQETPRVEYRHDNKTGSWLVDFTAENAAVTGNALDKALCVNQISSASDQIKIGSFEWEREANALAAKIFGILSHDELKGPQTWGKDEIRLLLGRVEEEVLSVVNKSYAISNGQDCNLVMLLSGIEKLSMIQDALISAGTLEERQRQFTFRSSIIPESQGK